MTVRDASRTRRSRSTRASRSNAAGSAAGDVMRAFGVSRGLPLLKAMNLVTSKPASDIALAAPTCRRTDADARPVARTCDRRHRPVGDARRSPTRRPSRQPRSTRSSPQANEAFPALRLTRDDVTLVHRGIVPAVENDANGAPTLLVDPIVYDHAADGAAGAMTVVGVKYTTARRVAQQRRSSVSRSARQAPAGRREPRRPSCPAPASPITRRWRSKPRARATSSCRSPTIRHLIALYAERAADIVRLMHERPDLREPVAADGRRPSAPRSSTSSGTRWRCACPTSSFAGRASARPGPPDDEALRGCAEIAGHELGWDATRRRTRLRP